MAPADASGAGEPPRSAAYSVLDAGAKGDGITDDTPAFQAALDAVGKAGGGTVLAPRGTYLIHGHLDIPDHVTLEGVWSIPTAWAQYKGTTLLAVEGEGRADGPAFITLHLNATLKGVAIFYPDQTVDPPKPYPWTIAGAGSDNPSILDVLIVNPYQAVDFGTRPSGRHLIRNLYGMPLYKGLFIDQCYDVGRVENVHFWPFWNAGDNAKQEKLFKYIRENATAFIFARTDWESVVNTFSWGYRVGYRFTESKSGCTNGSFVGIGADATEIAVQVDAAAPYGLLITNGEFVAFHGDEPIAVVVGKDNIGNIQFNNCAFWGPMAQVARIRGIGVTTFSSCSFVEWDGKNRGQPAIEALEGSLIVTGCNFNRPGTHVVLGENIDGAAITGNRFTGVATIRNLSDVEPRVLANFGSRVPKEAPGTIVIDDSEDAPLFTVEGEWLTGTGGGDYLGITRWAYKGDGNAVATWRPDIEKTGRYAVYVWHGGNPGDSHASNAPFTVTHAEGESIVRVNQKANLRSWNLLGEFRFEKGTSGSVRVTNGANANVVADAVKFVPVGGK